MSSLLYHNLVCKSIKMILKLKKFNIFVPRKRKEMSEEEMRKGEKEKRRKGEKEKRRRGEMRR